MIPASIDFDVGATVPVGTVPRAPDGNALATAAWVRARFGATWAVPTPEPDLTCDAVWTFASPRIDEVAGEIVLVFELADASSSDTSCRFVDGVEPAELLWGALSVRTTATPFARWQDALASLPAETSRPDTTDWAWLPHEHQLGATFELGDPPVVARRGVAVALALDDEGRLVPGPVTLHTVAQSEVAEARALIRAVPLAPLALDLGE